MKVLHLMSSAGFYGAENVVINLSTELQGLGHHATVGLFENAHQPANSVAEQMQKRGVRVARVPCRRRWDPGTIRCIRELAVSDGFDLIHTHGYKSDIYGYFAARRGRIPVVSTCHLWTGSTPAVKFYERLDAFFLRRASAVVGVSDAITTALQQAGIPRRKTRTIYNGINVAAFQGGSPALRTELGITDRPLIGTVGRLEKQKGIEYLIRAARTISAEFPDAMLVIAGEGSLRGELTEQIHRLNLERHVLLLGERTDMANFYASLDVFVLASLAEGMPMTLLEAMAAGKTVIATNVGAVHKLVTNERTGLLVEPADVNALANAILKCLTDSQLRAKLGKAAAELVGRVFSSDAMAKQYLKVYQEACEGRARTQSDQLLAPARHRNA